MENDTPRIPEFAHYYGDWIWDEELTGWIKSLLLFFDGIALAVPSARADQLIESNPVLAQPLAELGLLRNYWPNSIFNWLKPYMPVIERFGTSLWRMAEIFDRTAEGETLSASDLRELDRVLSSDEGGRLLRANLETYYATFARAAQKYGGTPPQMNANTVGMVSWLLRQNITDVAIQSVIDDEEAAAFVAAIIGSHDAGRAKIVVGDLAQVGVDLSTVPLDEVLGFRAEYGNEYRRYSSDVRRFALELSLMGEADQRSALTERRAELDDRAERLRRTARAAFARQTLSFGFGFAGAAWTLVHGDPWGGVFAAGAALTGITRSDPGAIGAAYTYILRARAELTR
jgi:hypothetical protein